MAFQNEFTWSKSRAGTLDDCARKYYLHYYAYWNGWQRDAPPDAQRLYRLRSLMSVPAWAGVVTHDTIAWLLAYVRDGSGNVPALSKVLDYANNRLTANWEFSASKRYWSERKSNNPNWFGLTEHELDLPLPGSTLERVKLQVANCLLNLYDSDLFQRIVTSDISKWMSIDERASFLLDGVKIWAVPDFMYVTRDDRVEIIDWKTGQQRDGDIVQLTAYASYARIAHEIPFEAIDVSAVYLKGEQLQEVTRSVTTQMVSDWAAHARKSMAGMTTLLAGAAREDNVTLPVINFPMTEDRQQCDRCNFRNECHGAP